MILHHCRTSARYSKSYRCCLTRLLGARSVWKLKQSEDKDDMKKRNDMVTSSFATRYGFQTFLNGKIERTIEEVIIDLYVFRSSLFPLLLR